MNSPFDIAPALGLVGLGVLLGVAACALVVCRLLPLHNPGDEA